MKVTMRTRLRFCLALLAAGTLAGAAQAQDFPGDKPIRMVVPFAPGSGSDNIARALVTRVSAATGWKFVIDNKAGANGVVAAQEVKRSRPDGYTLFYTGNTTHGANSALFKSLPYDPVADFEPITRVGVFPLVLLVRPALGVNSVAELVQLAKAQPGTLTFGWGSAGPRVAEENFRHAAQIQIRDVPYKSSPQALTDLIGGHLSAMFLDTVAGAGSVRAGTLRALAVTSTRRIDALSNVPTMVESGFPGFETLNWSGVFVPRGTPAAVQQALFKAISATVATDDWKRFAADAGGYADVLTPAQTADWVAREIRLYRETLQRAGVEPE